MAKNDRGSSQFALIGILRRTAWFILLWLILAGASTEEPVMAIIVIALATASSLWLWPALPRQVVYVEVLGFLLYFIRHSVGGGWDVARRALHPQLPLSPALLTYPIRLERDVPRVFFVLVISLFPGTASTKLEGRILHVHVLDKHMDIEGRLRELETRVARVCGEVIEEPADKP